MGPGEYGFAPDPGFVPAADSYNFGADPFGPAPQDTYAAPPQAVYSPGFESDPFAGGSYDPFAAPLMATDVYSAGADLMPSYGFAENDAAMWGDGAAWGLSGFNIGKLFKGAVSSIGKIAGGFLPGIGPLVAGAAGAIGSKGSAPRGTAGRGTFTPIIAPRTAQATGPAALLLARVQTLAQSAPSIAARMLAAQFGPNPARWPAAFRSLAAFLQAPTSPAPAPLTPAPAPAPAAGSGLSLNNPAVLIGGALALILLARK